MSTASKSTKLALRQASDSDTEFIKEKDRKYSHTLLADELCTRKLKTERTSTPIFQDIAKKVKDLCQQSWANPFTFLLSFVIFAALCSAGLVLIFVFLKAEQDRVKDEAYDLAVETGEWFSSQLDQAILPVFSIAQFVTELDIFHKIPSKIGPMGLEGSLPFLPPSTPDGPVKYRNVTGVCDDPGIVKRFDHIAATVKRQAKMEGVLVNIQLVPAGVICLLYPMVNTEDFPPGVVMDNSGAQGLDLFKYQLTQVVAKKTIAGDELTIQGPIPLSQCKGCPPTVEKAFVARLPVRLDSFESMDNPFPYTRWGIAAVLINWAALVDRSGMYETFSDRGLAFRLTRTDELIDPETNLEFYKTVVLAETDNFASMNDTTVSATLDTTDNMWEMTVAYRSANVMWAKVLIPVTVIMSFFFSALVLAVLLQKKSYSALSEKYKEAIAHPQKLRIKYFLEEQESQEQCIDIQEEIVPTVKPIGDLFAGVTALYADIDGFTAWSSERDPQQVFTLLQVIFGAFDRIRKEMDIFKVETIGDCYVALAGLPNPQPDHAWRMVRFAQQCLLKSQELTKRLETSLGPDTGDLRLRFGVHSGPVTAGVIVGNKSRFQLYGESLTIAATMESTGEGGRIQVSQDTADLLVKEGKRGWLVPRDDPVLVNGRGVVRTCWVKISRKQKVNKAGFNKTENSSELDHSHSSDHSDLWGGEKNMFDPKVSKNEKLTRLVEWHVESIAKLLRQVVVQHKKTAGALSKKGSYGVAEPSKVLIKKETPLDEVTEVITLPKFDPSKAAKRTDAESMQLDPAVISQLRDFVTAISQKYSDNPFHDFEHASHVTQSVHKLLDRIATPEDVNYEGSKKTVASDLHAYTFGITSDPLTHFAVVFSALIHDVDHTGVPNGQLAKENPYLANRYRNKSIAEQNSVDIAWDMLMQPRYKDLQNCIFADETELLRFRQLVVNIVLATDIFDKELKDLRNMRWDKAFHPEKYNFDGSESYTNSTKSSTTGSTNLSKQKVKGTAKQQVSEAETLKLKDVNRKATIVIEHIIQASDVAHTMQHFHIFKKWNERFFRENYLSWKMGRCPTDGNASKDPTETWYRGELWFFDNYVIPLAQKLAECGVFGVASDECLIYATENRKLWAETGKEIVAEMAARCVADGLGEATRE